MKAVLLSILLVGAPISGCLGSKGCGTPKSTTTVTVARGDTAWGLTMRANPKLGCAKQSAVDWAVKRNGGGPKIGQPYVVGVWS